MEGFLPIGNRGATLGVSTENPHREANPMTEREQILSLNHTLIQYRGWVEALQDEIEALKLQLHAGNTIIAGYRESRTEPEAPDLAP